MQPCAIAQQRNVWAVRPILASIKIAPEHRTNAERLKEAAAHSLGLNRLRARCSTQKITAPL